MKIITNRPIPSRFEPLLKNEANEEDVLFAVVGDLNLKGRYAESVMFFTKDRLIAFDDDMAFKRIVNVPSRKIGNKSIKVIMDTAQEQDCSLWTNPESL